MSSPVTYQLKDSVATITMDDGKVNVMSVAMLSALNAALDKALEDRAVVVLTGRSGTFSAGFDLKTLTAGGSDAQKMVTMGFELAHRMLSFPTPIIVACNGHAIAMGVFLVLAADYRLGRTDLSKSAQTKSPSESRCRISASRFVASASHPRISIAQ
jgi:enoyl-CoA hydratase